MNNKQRETIQKVIGILWALSYGQGDGIQAVSDAEDMLIELLEKDVTE